MLLYINAHTPTCFKGKQSSLEQGWQKYERTVLHILAPRIPGHRTALRFADPWRALGCICQAHLPYKLSAAPEAGVTLPPTHRLQQGGSDTQHGDPRQCTAHTTGAVLLWGGAGDCTRSTGAASYPVLKDRSRTDIIKRQKPFHSSSR